MSNINICFIKDGASIKMQVKSDMMFAELVFKYINKLGINNIQDYSFIHNSKPLNPNSYKSLQDLYLNDGAQIRVVSGAKFLNIFFNLNGRTISVQGQSNMKFSELAAKFYNKAGIEQGQQPTFIFSSKQISPNETKTLSELNIQDQSKIEVVLTSLVIGAA